MTALFKHQQQALSWSKAINYNCALFWEPRTGKSRGTLEVFKDARTSTPNLRLFVACPMSLITNVWQRNVAEFTDLSFKPFKKITDFMNPPDVTALNFESVISAKQLVLIRKMLLAHPYLLAIDESTKIAEPKSLTTKTLLSLRPLVKHAMILTGSEIRNSELDYWGQISFIQPGLLPSSFYAFRNEYFYLTKQARDGGTIDLPQQEKYMTCDYVRDVIAKCEDFNLKRQATQVLMKYAKYTVLPFPAVKTVMQIIQQSSFHYVINPQKREKLINLIKPYCMWVKKRECFDLPPTVDQEREVFLTEPETKAYNDMEKYLVAQVGEQYAVATVALAKLMKLRQGCSGFFYDENNVALVSGHSKLNELAEVFEEMGKQQVVIYAEFKEEFEQIVAMIEKRGGTVATVYGETADRDASIRGFESGAVQYLVAHPRSAAHGLDFQFCSVMVFYSWSHSNDLMTQARERLMGPKQDKKALYIYLVAKRKNGEATIDQAMLDVVRGKATIQEIVYRIVRGQ